MQDATNKAIAGIDNVKSVAPDVANPFAKSTAEATATTADRVQIGNEMTEDTNALLQRIAERLDQMSSDGGSIGGGFIGASRGFSVAA